MPGKFFLYQYQEGDVITMKKKHPCGSKEWTAIRVGGEVKLRCRGCGREMEMDRPTLEKSTVKVDRTGEQ
ncbi:MAG: DUF951 domain-containing protein [Clostridiales bacterium]|nr:DUF951 domain-containing protein [Clostridiales bacterium]